MQFFKRTLNEPPPAQVPVERRQSQRYSVHADFPLKAVLSFVARDDSGAPMSDSRHNWHWKGTLLNFSNGGARMRMGPGLRAEMGDTCDLLVAVGENEMRIPCHVANITHEEDATFFGLRHAIDDAQTDESYRQLVDAVAVASTFRLHSRNTKPDESGYLVEKYESDHGARLTVWRHPKGAVAVAFELVLRDGVVRAATGLLADYLNFDNRGALTIAPLERAKTIHQSFQWITPNLSEEIPADVRAFLRHYSG